MTSQDYSALFATPAEAQAFAASVVDTAPYYDFMARELELESIQLGLDLAESLYEIAVNAGQDDLGLSDYPLAEIGLLLEERDCQPGYLQQAVRACDDHLQELAERYYREQADADWEAANPFAARGISAADFYGV